MNHSHLPTSHCSAGLAAALTLLALLALAAPVAVRLADQACLYESARVFEQTTATGPVPIVGAGECVYTGK